MNRVFALAVLAFTAVCAGAQHEHHPAQAQHRVSTAALMVTDDPAARVLTLRLGPLELPANSDHMQVAQPPELYLAIPFDGWITAYHPRIADEQGNMLPGRMLHHVAFWNTARSDFLCPNKLEHIFGAGGEMNDWPALPGYGYRVRKGERIKVTSMFHNPAGTSYSRAWLEVKIEYQPEGGGVALKSVYPAWFDVQECGDSSFDLAPGSNTRSGKFALKHNGVLLGVGGHMHDFGSNLQLENLTRKEPIAQLPPKLDSKGRIIGMPIAFFLDRGGYRLNRGDVLRATATYDNPGIALPQGAMGIVVGYFLPDDQEQMASLQRTQKK